MSAPGWHGGGQRLLVVVGPSGAGKDAVLSGWLAALPAAQRPHRVRRTITRAPDAHEAHEPLDAPSFLAEQARAAFAVTWQAHGLHYGVRWSELAPLARGAWVVLNGSRAHLSALQALAPALRLVEITAPDALRAARLGARGREAEAARQARLGRAVAPVVADHRIVNDQPLDVAIAQLHAWWLAQHLKEPA